MEPSKDKSKINQLLNIFKNIKHKIFGRYGEQVFNVVTAISSILACVAIAAPMLLFLAPAVGFVLAIGKLILDASPPAKQNDKAKNLVQTMLQKAKKIFDTKAFQIATNILTALLLVASFVLTGGVAAIAVPLVVLGAGCIRAAIETKKDYTKTKEVLALKDELQNLRKLAGIKANLVNQLEEHGFKNPENKKELNPNIASKNNVLSTVISVLTSLSSCVCSMLILDIGGVIDNFKKIGDAIKQVESKETLTELKAEKIIKQQIQQLKKELNMENHESVHDAIIKIQDIKVVDSEASTQAQDELETIKTKNSRSFFDILKKTLDTEEKLPTHQQTLEEDKEVKISRNNPTQKKMVTAAHPNTSAEEIVVPETVSAPNATKGLSRDL